jgi:hypothetical protein
MKPGRRSRNSETRPSSTFIQCDLPATKPLVFSSPLPANPSESKPIQGEIFPENIRALNPRTQACPRLPSPSPPPKEERAGERRHSGFMGRGGRTVGQASCLSPYFPAATPSRPFHRQNRAKTPGIKPNQTKSTGMALGPRPSALGTWNLELGTWKPSTYPKIHSSTHPVAPNRARSKAVARRQRVVLQPQLHPVAPSRARGSLAVPAALDPRPSTLAPFPARNFYFLSAPRFLLSPADRATAGPLNSNLNLCH